MPHGARDERRATVNGSNLANKRVKVSHPYKNTNEHDKSQHAQNLAHCGALEMEGNRAKERNTRHSTPKRPHIKRKPMRPSKHTHERKTAPHGQEMRPSRQSRRGRARAKQQRTGCNESRHAMQTQHRHGRSTGTAAPYRTAFAAHAIRKNYEINAHFRKCYESHLEPIMPDYKQLWPINCIFLLFPLFSSRFLAFSLVLPLLLSFRFS